MLIKHTMLNNNSLDKLKKMNNRKELFFNALVQPTTNNHSSGCDNNKIEHYNIHKNVDMY